MKLEKSGIDPLTCPPTQRDKLFFDDALKGFGLRVTNRGAKVWLLQYHHPLQGTKRVVLGRYPEITPHKARQLATRLRAEVLMGGNPAGDRKQAREAERLRAETDAFTLKVLIEKWESNALRDRRENYRAEATRALEKAFEAQLEKPAEALDVRRVRLILDEIAGAHPTMARRTRAYGRAAYEWARKRQLVSSNPFASVEVDGREISRDRVLSDAELGEAWRASGELGTVHGAFVRIAILTLQRRGEIAGMRWAELAADYAIWTIPAERAKNRRAHVVHLAIGAQAVLRGLTRRPGAELVFETYSRQEKGKRAPISGFSDILDQLREKIAAERAEHASQPGNDGGASPLDWRLHDFRRTGVTAMARLGVAPHVADRILNHVEGTIRGVAAVYQRHDFLAERETALNLWAQHVAAVAKLDVPSENNQAAEIHGAEVARADG